jgi:hypothetical protein
MKNFVLRFFACVLLCTGGAAHATDSAVAPDQRRGVEQTFLTYPEWFLVHSPAEYARFVRQHPAHRFPFLGHTGQIWSSYGAVTREQMRADYPSNIGYHVMICVIAGSTTIEYVMRSLYENTVGRLSWGLSSAVLTAEDAYGARVAQDYVDFIRKEPWYLYDFGAKLKGLWTDTPLRGPNLLRKWERRYALTTEYLVKAAYGKLIERATRAAYVPALMTTQVVAANVPAALPAGVVLVKPLPGGQAVLDLPRYFAFRLAATELAAHGARLTDIAGNSSVILVTVISAEGKHPVPPDGRLLFDQPILTEPGRKRSAIVMPVAALTPYLTGAPAMGVEVEHVYDY